MDGKGYIWTLLMEAKSNHVNVLIDKEFKFLSDRKFRFDYVFYVSGEKWAVEYEGINAPFSRHTSVTGYTKDTEKYNLAQINGWKLLRYTALNYKDFQKHLQTIIKNNQNE